MSGVIIRCPNCGATESALGECGTCHEADTRYFCTNHEAGRWLDGPGCTACGARYGAESATRRPLPRARPAPPASWPSTSPPIEAPEPVPADGWSGSVRTPGSGDVFEIEPRGVELPDRPMGGAFPAESLTLAATAAGCARRAVVLFLILLALAALAIFGLLGGGIRLL